MSLISRYVARALVKPVRGDYYICARSMQVIMQGYGAFSRAALARSAAHRHYTNDAQSDSFDSASKAEAKPEQGKQIPTKVTSAFLV
jgi:hypothetical protein